MRNANVGGIGSPKKISSILAAAIGVIGVSLSFMANAADWSDTYIGYRVGNKFHDCCGNGQDEKKEIYSLGHSSKYKYGGNFFNVDVLMSDKNDPINGGDTGAMEFYLVYRHQLSLSAVSGNELKFGVVKDIAITAGFDLNSDNNAFAPKGRKFVVGPTLKFDVTGGFLDVSLLFRNEQNHNGYVAKVVNFDNTYGLNAAWSIPVTSINSKIDGFMDRIGPKGKDGFGFETKPETLMRVYLMYDVGNLANQPKTFYAGIGYEYWNNKYGGNAAGPGYSANGGKTNSPVLAVQAHF
jgi:nucleoside-specific outer membrane channel protein Tsx